MALTLPYPSLVFVPLDILTADQMNEIVANYEYIANQFPLSSDKLDFTKRVPITSASFSLPGGYNYYRVALYFDSPATGGYINIRATAGVQAYCRRMMMRENNGSISWVMNEYNDVPTGTILLGSGAEYGSKNIRGTISATFVKSNTGQVLLSTGVWHAMGVLNSGVSTAETYFSTDKTNEDIAMTLYRDNGSFSSVIGCVECYKNNG